MQDDSSEDILEDITNLESKFYQEGYQSGFEHGQLHGLYEGRELGQEKAWEIWEEVGFYEGFALFWKDLISSLTSNGPGEGIKNKDKVLNHANQLLVLIGSFPTTNPTPIASSEPSSSSLGIDKSMDMAGINNDKGKEVDMEKLMMSIRAKYRLLCMMVGSKPRLVAARMVDGTGETNGNGNGSGNVMDVHAMEGIEGPMKGVDTNQLKF